MYNTGMEEKILRVYVDNSVVSGMFDDHIPERVEQTERFWQAVIDGTIRVIASDVLDEELAKAPQHVRDFFNDLPELHIEQIESTKESVDLAEQYIAAGVVGRGSFNDCQHVALATIFADGIVSWNLGDMVKRADKYNSVNAAMDFPEIKIVTPNEFMEAHHGDT